MCVILHFEPNAEFDKDKFFNAVWNNPHGFGLVLRDPVRKRIQIIRELNDKQENDPEYIWDLIQKNKDIERILHVRWASKGKVSLNNVHPFPVYNSDEREIVFMHNGTLHMYADDKSNLTPDYSKMYGDFWADQFDDEIPKGDKSDSLNFAEQVLQPLLLSFKGENGQGDYQNPFFQTILDKFWGTSVNNGMLISNDLEPLRIGNGWSSFSSDGKGPKCHASNSMYFSNDLKRGPEKERREAEEKRNQKKSSKAPWNTTHSANSNSRLAWSTAQMYQVESIGVTMSDEINKGMENFWAEDVWEGKGLKELGYLTNEEWKAFVANDFENYLKMDDKDRGIEKLDCTYLLAHFAEKYTELYGEYEKLQTKHTTASNMIAELKCNKNKLDEVA